ncbi:hypothetical protein SAMN04488067_10496 [Halorubrum xinjiangense]|uniref:Lipoprotein n=1 Tax=Halorubrum xinjiangense TaxID=261291 RepID=A0A1G7KUG0_9EURY|nr:hypothetical protein [Halorubrum xinjiangense]SDF40853.1 hypothetical protein SAMN04488067_10496 [Halorubrum xinjiangense]
MRRRALLASAAAVSTASLAGCPTPPWSDAAVQFDGAELTFRREHTGEFDPADSDRLGGVELRTEFDRAPPRLLIRGMAMGGVQECYRVNLVDVGRSAERLSIEVAVEQRPFISACNDAGEGHPYEVGVAFSEAPVPERVVVRHGEETVLEADA